MSGGKGQIEDKDRTGGFDKNPQNINRTGQNVSIRKQLRELLAADGKMKIEWKNVIEVEDGKFVEILLPKQTMIVMKLFHWAMSSKDVASTKAIQMIMEHMDGRAAQSISISTDEPINQVQLSDDQFQEIMKELKPKEEKK